MHLSSLPLGFPRGPERLPKHASEILASTVPTPRACGWRSLSRNNEPISDALCRARGTPASAPTDPALATTRTSRPTPSLHLSRQEPLRFTPVRGRTQLAPGRLPSYRSRDVATSSHPRLRIRPREAWSSTPVRFDHPRAPHQRVLRFSSELDRALRAVPTRLATAFHDERTSSIRDACDQRLPPIPSATCTHRRSATGCQFPCGRHPPPRGGGLTGAWRVSRRPTRFGLISHRRRRRVLSSRAMDVARVPLTPPSPSLRRPLHVAFSSATRRSRSPARPRPPSPVHPVKESELP